MPERTSSEFFEISCLFQLGGSRFREQNEKANTTIHHVSTIMLPLMIFSYSPFASPIVEAFLDNAINMKVKLGLARYQG